MEATCPTCSRSNPYVLGSRPKFCMFCGKSMIVVASAQQPPPATVTPYYAPVQPSAPAPMPKLTVRAEVEGHRGIKFEHLSQLGPVHGEAGVRQGQQGFASLKDLEAEGKALCAKRVIEIGDDG